MRMKKPKSAQDHLVALARHPKCVGIGEAGLDYHYDKPPRDIAARVFRTHIAAARQSGLPIVIHARDADADIAAILREEMGKGAVQGPSPLLHLIGPCWPKPDCRLGSTFRFQGF